MSQNINDVINLVKNKKDSYVNELFDFLTYESVSTDSSKSNDVEKCANYLVDHLKKIGANKVKLIKTKKHPIVYGEFFSNKQKPTLLIYGHYDVQPEDPIELWKSPPFKPEVRDGFIYARGVADDKGQVFCHLKAIESWLTSVGELPVNIKLIIEGEEEIGSPNLEECLKKHKDLFDADVVVISDSPMYGPNQPALSCSLRGLVYAQVNVIGPKADLHSGQFGGIIQNPIQALSLIISKLKDEDDRVLIPGFYDDVLPITNELKQSINSISVDEKQLAKQLEVPDLVGLKECSINERKWFQPTLDCNGIIGGFTGEGAKTIIPSKVSAKISMRLVSNQNPKTIMKLFESYVKHIKPKGVNVEIEEFHGASPARMDTTSSAFVAAKKAFEDTYKNDVKVIGEGGSIPVVESFQRILGLDTVMMGFNLPDDGIHSPNERFGVENYLKGIETAIRYYKLAEGINAD